MKSAIIFLIINAFLNTAQSSKILIVYPLFGTSHYILGNAIARTLVEAGHDVTMVSPFEEKNPPKNGTWTNIVLTGLFESGQESSLMKNMFQMETMHPVLNFRFMNYLGNEMTTKNVLSHEAFQKLLKSNQKFDVVIVEQFWSDAIKAVAHHFKAPYITVSSMGATSWVNHLVANPSPYSYISNIFLCYSSKMSVWERLKNTLFNIAEIINREFIFYPEQEKLMKKYFPDPPNFYDVIYNTSLVLLNSHISTNHPVPLVPAMIDIGGYHVFPPKPLPKDLQDFLDSSKDGVIYFSMGSNLKSKYMPEKQRKALLSVFSKLKQKVLWKFEDDNLPGKPSNVKIRTWLPQQSILAHPNVKLFITHGGLLSTTETIYHGVPVLAIPIFGDQSMNAAQIELSGFGKALKFSELNEENLKNSLDELLNNPKYKENAQMRSKVFHDRESKPRDRLVYWVEYVIRHKGAHHLRVAGIDLKWYQYLLLDIFAIILGTIIIFMKLFKVIISKLCCRKTSNIKKIKTN